VSCHLHLILQFDLTLCAYLYAFLIAAVKSDLPSPGKLNVQFPLPGNVGFAPSQSHPMSAFTKSEAVDSHLKQSSTEVNRFFTQASSLKFCQLYVVLKFSEESLRTF